MKNDQIRLIPVVEGIERGNITRDKQENEARTVFGRAFSVGEREFYDSVQAGFELALKVEVWADEYNGELALEYNGEEYRVVRTYDNRRHRTVELTCEKIKGRR
ncbi:MAG: hypothetical protein J6C52_03210 [Clostridia bacterium]|nr:hypothetical protein [Clostridia bacterium]